MSRPSNLGAALIVARRELGSYFHEPLAYVVGVLFLAVQGLSFALVVKVLSDPRSPAAYGAVLRTHFGGTFLYWTVLLVVVSVISMRAIAEDMRQGTWESLLTTGVAEGAVVFGKWLAAVAFYIALWAPTTLYLVVLYWFAPADTSIDGGPIISSYLAVIVSGAGFIALGIAASATTRNQIIAAIASFAPLFMLLMLGELDDVAPGWLDGSALMAIVEAIDLRAHMDRFARGVIDLRGLALWVSMVAIGLSVATAVATMGRRSAGRQRRRAAGAALVAISAVLLVALANRHPVQFDVTAKRVNSLERRTIEVLDELGASVDVLVIRPAADVFGVVFAEVDRVLDRMIAAQPMLVRRDLDPSRDPARVEELADRFALSPQDLAEGGAVVFQLDDNRRVVDLLDIASFDYDDLGVGGISELRAEQAFASALAEIAAARRTLVCIASIYGGYPWRDGGSNLVGVADKLERDGVLVEDIGSMGGGIPGRCHAVLLIGMAASIPADDALALSDYLSSGGSAFIAIDGRPVRTSSGFALPASGLELVLGELGVGLPSAVVIDPESSIDLPGAWTTLTGYANHPVTRGFQGRRLTAWVWPRVVTFVPPDDSTLVGTELISGSLAAWGETDLRAIASGSDLSGGATDILGSPSIAVAVEHDRGGRLVVVGSARSLSSDLVARGVGVNHEFVASAVWWLTHRTRSISLGDKTPEHVRLIMTRGQTAVVFAVCVGVIPLAFVFLGLLVWWRRRRG